MGYETYRIADLIDEIAMGPFGSNIKVSCFVDSGVPVLNGSNLEGFSLSEKTFRYVTREKADSLNKANAHRGDIVITHRGTLGQIVFIPQDSKYDRYVISQSQFRVRCNDKVLPEYLVYYFHTPIGQHKLLSNNSPLKIAIVVDMWLTGFDVPSLATMYVYKPMAGHNLMQAIARVNRVFKDKEGGLVVDYVGIAAALKQAMNDYTARDKKNYGDTDVSKAAYPKFLEKLSICRDLFHGFSYEKFMTGSDLDRAKLISGGVNFILGKSVAEYDLPDNEKTQNVFIKEALLLKQALSLCSSLVDEQTRMEAAFFESVRTMTVRLVSGGTGKKFTLPEVNERINELLKHSIKSEGVINLFSDVQTEFSLFDPKFLEEVANMKEKNLAVELLKKLISEQVSVYRRTNIVKSEKFSEIIQSAMNRYLNGMLTNEEVIQELLKLAKDIAAAAAEGEKLGLTADELAFYDALTKPQAIKDFYEHDELIAITKELTDLLRKNQTIDWQKKESARAGMRRLVKRLLKKHKYPPEGMDDAVQTVMSQCEMWTDNVMTA